MPPQLYQKNIIPLYNSTIIPLNCYTPSCFHKSTQSHIYLCYKPIHKTFTHYLHFFDDKSKQKIHFFEGSFMEKLHFFEDKTIYCVSHSAYFHIKKRCIKKTCILKTRMQVLYSENRYYFAINFFPFWM